MTVQDFAAWLASVEYLALWKYDDPISETLTWCYIVSGKSLLVRLDHDGTATPYAPVDSLERWES